MLQLPVEENVVHADLTLRHAGCGLAQPAHFFAIHRALAQTTHLPALNGDNTHGVGVICLFAVQVLGECLDALGSERYDFGGTINHQFCCVCMDV